MLIKSIYNKNTILKTSIYAGFYAVMYGLLYLFSPMSTAFVSFIYDMCLNLVLQCTLMPIFCSLVRDFKKNEFSFKGLFYYYTHDLSKTLKIYFIYGIPIVVCSAVYKYIKNITSFDLYIEMLMFIAYIFILVITLVFGILKMVSCMRLVTDNYGQIDRKYVLKKSVIIEIKYILISFVAVLIVSEVCSLLPIEISSLELALVMVICYPWYINSYHKMWER